MQNLTKCDIMQDIINSLERSDYMINSKNHWEVPKYSGNQIEKIGKQLAIINLNTLSDNEKNKY